ncbi:MAG: FAD-dependent oxidoreductase [Pseudomonadota bacterium]
MSQFSVIVVGAGVAGLCTAWSLLDRGARVTVVEREAAPAPRAASTDHHRLIRHGYPSRPGYGRRIPQAFAAWREIWARLEGAESRWLHETGVLTCSRAAGDHGDRAVLQMEAAGVDVERLPAAELAHRFAHLETANVAYGAVSPGGALMCGRILTDLASALRARGAEVLERSPVSAVTAGGEVRLADGRALSADAVLLSAGAEAPRLAPQLFSDLTYNRTLIVYARPPEDLAEAWRNAPSWSGLDGDGDLWGLAPVEGLPPKLGSAALRRVDPGDHDRQIRPEEIQALLAAYGGRFRGIDRFTLAWGQANYWMGAEGEEFQLRRDGRLWGVSADSGHGFKFGALTGQDVAEAMTGAASFEEVRLRMTCRAA